MEPTLAFVVTSLAVTVIGFALSLSRRGDVASGHAGQVPVTAHVPVGPVAAFDRARGGLGRPLRVDDASLGDLALALSSAPTLFSWGFLYYATFSPVAGGGTHISVSARSRFIAPFPAIRDWHLQRCLRALEAAAVRPIAAAPAAPARCATLSAMPAQA